jgi:prepilin-type N-terminal cleavage/methylation domain-containing protein
LWKNFKNGLTLIELIFVIVILGILFGFASNFFLSLYLFYDETKNFTKRDSELTNTLLITSKHLRNRLENSAIARSKSDISKFVSLDSLANNYTNSNSKSYNLEWIGVDNDSFNGMYDESRDAILPAWSGFIDLESKENNKTQIKSPMTNNILLQQLIYSLSFGKVDIFDKTQSVAIFFKGASTSINYSFAWDNNDSQVFKIYAKNSNSEKEIFYSSKTESFITDNSSEFLIYEQYQLSWSAYLLSLENKNLYLYWNYRPWNGENFLQHGTKSLLLQNISSFNFYKLGKRLKVEICIKKEQFRYSNDYEICREVIIY